MLVIAACVTQVAVAACPPSDDGSPTIPVPTAVQWLEKDLVLPAAVAASADARALLQEVGSPRRGEGAFELADTFLRAYGEERSGDALPGHSNAIPAPLLEELGAGIATQAVLTTERGDLEHVTFAAVHWPSPLAPRLRVVRIPEEIRGEANRDEVMDLLGTCAVDVEEWVAAPEDVALRFLDENVHAAMLVSGRDRETGEDIEFWIEPENLVAALRFEDPRTARLDSYSAWFAGEAPGPVAMARLLPRLRASLGPRDLWDLYRSLQ